MSPPSGEDSFPASKKQLEDLRAALVYWGKITQRQSKLKFIRESKRLMAVDEYKGMAEDEWQFLKQEKEKFLDEEAAKKTDINYEMLKVAQDIDKEAKAMKSNFNWDEVDSDAEDEDIGQQPAQPKKRGKAQKFTEIAKDAFPTLGDDDGAKDLE